MKHLRYFVRALLDCSTATWKNEKLPCWSLHPFESIETSPAIISFDRLPAGSIASLNEHLQFWRVYVVETLLTGSMYILLSELYCIMHFAVYRDDYSMEIISQGDLFQELDFKQICNLTDPHVVSLSYALLYRENYPSDKSTYRFTWTRLIHRLKKQCKYA